MADPEHTPALDGFDRITVVLYRCGISMIALGLLANATTATASVPDVDRAASAMVCAGVALALANLHLYDKRFRWFFGATGWAGLTGLLAVSWWPMLPLADHVSFGLILVAASGLALKERFCFRVPLLGSVPLLLATSVFAGAAHGVWPLGTRVSAGLLALSGLPYALLAAAKWRMPLHFDIGDRSNYQI